MGGRVFLQMQKTGANSMEKPDEGLPFVNLGESA
jgi:hypothetical protein